MKKKTYGKRIAAWVLAAIMATSACPETVLLAAPVGEPQEDVEALSEEGEENIQENEEPGGGAGGRRTRENGCGRGRFFRIGSS